MIGKEESAKRVQGSLRERWRILSEKDGHVIISDPVHFRKLLITSNLEPRGVEPLFPTPMSSKIQERLCPRASRESKRSWKCLDGAGRYQFCYWVAAPDCAGLLEKAL
jgi:hypothetical protein